MTLPLSHDTIHTLDISAFFLALATILNWLPQAVLVLTFIWTLIRLYETDTIQRLIHGKRKDDEKA